MATITKNRTGTKTVTYKGKGTSGRIVNPTVTPLYNDGTCILKFRLSLNNFDVGLQQILNGVIKLWYSDSPTDPSEGQVLDLDLKGVVWTDGGFYDINRVFKIDKKTPQMSNLVTSDEGSDLLFKIRVQSDLYNITYGVNDVISDNFKGKYIYCPIVRTGATLPISNNVQTLAREEQYFPSGLLPGVGRLQMRIGYNSDDTYRNFKGRYKMQPYLEYNYRHSDGTYKTAMSTKFFKRVWISKATYDQEEFSVATDNIVFEQTNIGSSDVSCDSNCVIDDSLVFWVFNTSDAMTGSNPVDWHTDTYPNSDVKVTIKPNITDI